MRKIVLVNLLFVFVFANTLYAQSNTGNALAPVFIMTSFGNMGTTQNQSPVLQFKSTSNCIDVQNGIAVLSGERANGQFSIQCEVDPSFNSLGIKLYPNPAVSNTKLQVNNTPPNNEVFSLSIWTVEGQLINIRKETGDNLMQGLNIDLMGLPYGTYILKVESSKSIDILKFIKAR